MKRGRGVVPPPPPPLKASDGFEDAPGGAAPPHRPTTALLLLLLGRLLLLRHEVVTPFPEKTHNSRAADYFRLPFLVAFFLPPLLTAFLRFGMWGLTSLPSG